MTTTHSHSFEAKAFEDLEQFFKLKGETTPVEIIDICKKSHIAIDTYATEKSNAHRDALKAIVVLQYGCPLTADSVPVLQSRYNAELATMITDGLQTGRSHGLAQAAVATSIGKLEDLIEKLSDPQTRAKALPDAQKMHGDMLYLIEERAMMMEDYRTAPNLLKREMTVIDHFDKAFKAAPAAQAPAKKLKPQ